VWEILRFVKEGVYFPQSRGQERPPGKTNKGSKQNMASIIPTLIRVITMPLGSRVATVAIPMFGMTKTLKLHLTPLGRPTFMVPAPWKRTPPNGKMRWTSIPKSEANWMLSEINLTAKEMIHKALAA